MSTGCYVPGILLEVKPEKFACGHTICGGGDPKLGKLG